MGELDAPAMEIDHPSCNKLSSGGSELGWSGFGKHARSVPGNFTLRIEGSNAARRGDLDRTEFQLQPRAWHGFGLGSHLVVVGFSWFLADAVTR